MNKARRKKLNQALELIASARVIIEECQMEEQEALDNMPESLQESDLGTIMASNAEMLEEIMSYLEDHENELDDIING